MCRNAAFGTIAWLVMFGSTLIAQDAQSSNDAPRKTSKIRRRPIVGEQENWQQQYNRLTPEQKASGSWVIDYPDGEPRPDLYDDTIVSFRNSLGERFRYIQPADLRSALEMQDEVLEADRRRLANDEKSINRDTDDARRAYYDAREEEKEVKAEIEDLVREAQRAVDRAYDTRNFRCSEGNSWDVCTSHPDEKVRWLDARQKARRKAESDARSRAQRRVDEAVRRGKEALKKYRDAKVAKEGLMERVQVHKDLIKRQNSGDAWLFPGGKAPDSDQDRGLPVPGVDAKITVDENAKK